MSLQMINFAINLVRCLTRYSACYPNFGTVVVPRASVLQRYIAAVQRWITATRHMSNPAEQNNDQAALHHLYLNRTAQIDLRLEIDAAGSALLQLWPCSQPGPFYKRRTRGGAFEYCHEKSFDPMTHIRVGRGGRSLSFNANTSAEPRILGRRSRPSRPWLLHSNGKHSRLQEEVLAPMLRLYDHPTAELLHHPVLILDGFHHLCNVTTIADLLASSMASNGTFHSPGEKSGNAPWGSARFARTHQVLRALL